MTDLRSADVPGPRADDHVRGPDDAPVVLFYGDFACPKCARRLPPPQARAASALTFRHFALKAKHPRAVALAHAVEAAAHAGRGSGSSTEALYADQGRLEDPHLWAHCERARHRPRPLRARPPRRARPPNASGATSTTRCAAGATATPTVWIGPDDPDLLDTMVTFGIREARRIGPPTDGWAWKGSTYE